MSSTDEGREKPVVEVADSPYQPTKAEMEEDSLNHREFLQPMQDVDVAGRYFQTTDWWRPAGRPYGHR